MKSVVGFKFGVHLQCYFSSAIFAALSYSSTAHAQNTFPATGNVGIGTTSPASTLAVSGSGGCTNNNATGAGSCTGSSGNMSTLTPSSWPNLILADDQSGAAGAGGGLLFSAYNQSWKFAGIRGFATNGNASPTGDITFYTRTNSSNTYLSEVMRIQNTGSVGIGTASPTATLEVNKGTSAGNGVWIDGTNDTRLMIGRGQPTVWSWSNGWANPGDFSLIEEGASGSRIYVKPGGNVGIGTTAPQAALDVNGSVKVGADSVCNTSKAGAIHFTGTTFEGCNGTAWIAFGASPSGTWCGYYDSVSSTLVSACSGSNPLSSCPSGYTQIVIEAGTANTKTGYTCIKN